LRQINEENFRLVQEYGQQWGTNDQALMLLLVAGKANAK